MKRKTVAFMTALILAVSLSACSSDKPVSNNNSDAERIAELEQELEELKAENKELKEQLANLDTTKSSQQATSEAATNEAKSLLKTTIESPETSGVCGANLTWYYQNGVLVITGTGEMTDYTYHASSNSKDYVDSPWYDLREDIGWVIIDEGVTTIGNYSFAAFPTLSKVILPDSLTSIGKKAFGNIWGYGCENLKEITLPDSLISIKESAFSGCNIQEVTLPNSLTIIEDEAFNDCDIQEIIIPNSVKSIGRGAFSGCNIQEIIIPDSVTNIGTWVVDNRGTIKYKGVAYTREEFDNSIEELGFQYPINDSTASAEAPAPAEAQ